MFEAKFLLAGEWASRFRTAIKQCDLSQIPPMVEDLIKKELWKDRVHGVPERFYHCESLVEFITARPSKGMGLELDKITLLLRQAGNEKVLYLWRKATTAPKHKHHDTYNVSIKPEAGNSKAYTLDRLERERPELFQAVINCQLSANAAAIQAGWRKQPRPLDRLRSAWLKASAEERDLFRKEITERV